MNKISCKQKIHNMFVGNISITEEKPEVWKCATSEYGTYCQFPFIHNGSMHHQCTNLKDDEPDEVHCASSTLEDGYASDIKKCLLDSCVIGKLQGWLMFATIKIEYFS